MDGDIMVMVAGNQVILCASNIHEKNAERYMVGIIQKAGLPVDASKFGLSKVGDVNKLKILQKQGAGSIRLNVSLFDATVDHLERKSIRSRIGGGLMDEICALFSKEMSNEEIATAENLSAQIVLRYDKRVKGKTIGKETLNEMAKQILAENDDGFVIETLGGEKISADKVVVRKTVMLAKHGKSVFRQDAWAALENYHLELKAGGILEQ